VHADSARLRSYGNRHANDVRVNTVNVSVDDHILVSVDDGSRDYRACTDSPVPIPVCSVPRADVRRPEKVGSQLARDGPLGIAFLSCLSRERPRQADASDPEEGSH